jgi:phospholipase/carboxylesterase
MRYEHVVSSEVITLKPAVPARGAVIWLHGLGADGSDFVPAVPALGVPDTCPMRFVFPHAEARPISINNGYVMRAWYDLRTLTGDDEDEAGIQASERRLHGLIEQEIELGTPVERIVLAGFSQGGAMALHTALRYPQRLGGVLALSTYLPLARDLAAQAHPANKTTPIFMCHGLYDDVVPLQAGERSQALLKELGYAVRWQTYAMRHEVTTEELADIGYWLAAQLKCALP